MLQLRPSLLVVLVPARPTTATRRVPFQVPAVEVLIIIQMRQSNRTSS